MPGPVIRTYVTEPALAFEACITAAQQLGFEPTLVDWEHLHLWMKGSRPADRLVVSITDNGVGGVTMHVGGERQQRRGPGRSARRFIRGFERVLRQ